MGIVAKVKKAQLKQIIEAAIFVADKPVTHELLQESILAEFELSKKYLTQLLNEIEKDYADRGIRLVKVASGFRFQSDASLNPWVGRLWQEQVPRYSRALLETLSLIAYRQPITRGEIEQVRGVSVSSNIIKTLMERDWIKSVGHKEVPGRPALYATTSEFLDYFGLKTLAELPSVALFEEQSKQDTQALFPDEPVKEEA
ncbi:segregation and condensation protein B [Planctobacterium marinum]|uniref:Segregation and condensation protein B n=1 Tax=Planctobacterium marinum TaxID=1631968 RepID=A0AA48HSS2_9ALTE|nr:segregation and condensation protein B [Planctobacterium marinum]